MLLQLLHDTLLDEGLRVVKEMVANQNTDEVNVQVIGVYCNTLY